jgi:nicotinamidase-related amidase
MPYPLLDAIERAAIRDNLTPRECLDVMGAASPSTTAEQLVVWVKRFFRLWCRNQWKRERYAPVVPPRRREPRPQDLVPLPDPVGRLRPRAQGTPGAALCKELDPASITRVFRKGSDPGVDSYSGFFDNGRRNATGLGDWLRAEGITALSVLGLATDYCVKFTALDARDLGFDVTLLTQGCRGVELHAGDVARALDELRSAGVHVRE